MTEIHELVIQARIVDAKPAPVTSATLTLSPHERTQLIESVTRQVLAQLKRESRTDLGGRSW